METFFKPGDVVTVRTDLNVTRNGKHFPYYMDDKKTVCYFTSAMSKLAGKAVKIYSNDFRYEIEEDGHMFWWVDEMFQEYLDRNMPEYVQPTERDLMSLLGV